METKWVLVAVVALVLCLSSSAWAYMKMTPPPPSPTTVPYIDAKTYQPPVFAIAPPAPKVDKPAVVKRPVPPVQNYSVIMPNPFPSYPLGLYDWFGQDPFFYRTYPDRRWVVQPWRSIRQPGYPDKVYRA